MRLWKVLLVSALMSQTAIAAPRIAQVTGNATVYKVSDGDTYILNASTQAEFDGLMRFVESKSRGARAAEQAKRHLNPKYRSFKVRLGGIDTPESVHRDKSRNSAAGHQASRFAKQWLDRQRVQYQCWDVGKYGRLICSVQRLDKGDVGLQLIRQGHSDYITCWGRHPNMHREYLSAAGKETCNR